MARRPALKNDPAALGLPMNYTQDSHEDCSRISIGIDEAGRGCLAGPVVAAAVILPEHFDLPHLNDSKALSVKQRDILAPQIKSVALAWGLGLAWPPEIDRCNILQATFWAMGRAVKSLHPLRDSLAGIFSGTAGMPTAILLVDGNKSIPLPILSRLCSGILPAQKAIVGGDALEPAISAASILAKTFRDHLMGVLHRRYPRYDFLSHKGYGTVAHMEALRAYGPCLQHRLTFAGVLPPAASPKPGPAQALLW